MAQEVDLREVERTFLRANNKVMFDEALQDQANVAVVVRRVGGEDEEIIQVDYQTFVLQIGKDVVHEKLKGCRRVRKSEGHDFVFERSELAPESRFPFISFLDA
jgi:hypothetical protein